MSSEPVVVCTLVPTDLAVQRARWQALTMLAREETRDGLRVTFAAGSAEDLHALAAIENECCSWARWVVDGDVLEVASTGRGVQAAQQLFAPRGSGPGLPRA